MKDRCALLHNERHADLVHVAGGRTAERNDAGQVNGRPFGNGDPDFNGDTLHDRMRGKQAHTALGDVSRVPALVLQSAVESGIGPEFARDAKGTSPLVAAALPIVAFRGKADLPLHRCMVQLVKESINRQFGSFAIHGSVFPSSIAARPALLTMQTDLAGDSDGKGSRLIRVRGRPIKGEAVSHNAGVHFSGIQDVGRANTPVSWMATETAISTSASLEGRVVIPSMTSSIAAAR